MSDFTDYSKFEIDSQITKKIAYNLYYEGNAQNVLELALDSLNNANRSISEFPDLSWKEAIKQARYHCELLLTDIKKIVKKNKLRISNQTAIDLTLPEPNNKWLKIGEEALIYILRQWETGFGEAKHVMRFSPEYGFSSKQEFHSGDIFQRALLTEALCEVNEMLGGVLFEVLEHETNYLIENRVREGFGGWSYFPELPELPPDADDLAQVMQVLFKTGQYSKIDELCSKVLDVLFTDNYHAAQGSFETWIVPAKHRNPQQKMHAEWVKKAWGKGADPDVVSNLAWSLHMCYPEKYAEIISRAGDYIESTQDSDGKWSSSWYYGPFYGTHVCIRLLKAIKPSSKCLLKAFDFLLTQQNSDGGWGIDKESEPMSTAIALLILADTSFAVNKDTPNILQIASSALDYLQSAQTQEGVWEPCPFIKMDIGRADGHIWNTLIYKSKTITAMYVMKATFIWWQLSKKLK